jgi:hypothetical protein
MSETDKLNEIEDIQDFLWQVHKYTNDYIRFADTKAAFVVGISTALIGASFKATLFDNMFRKPLCQWSLLQYLGLVGISLLFTSIFCSILAIWPRFWNKQPTGHIFWESVVAHGAAEKFTKSVHERSSDQLSRTTSDHLFTLASIAKRKYHLVDVSLWTGIPGCFLIGIILFVQRALS